MKRQLYLESGTIVLVILEATAVKLASQLRTGEGAPPALMAGKFCSGSSSTTSNQIKTSSGIPQSLGLQEAVSLN